VTMKTHFVGKIVNPPSVRRLRPESTGSFREIQDINKIASFLANRGWNVFFEKGGEEGIVPALRSVTVDTSKKRSTQLNSILHEAGHAVMFADPEYTEKYKDGYLRVTTKKSTRTLRHKMEVLREEMTAWDRAELIVDLLDVKIDIQRFRDDRNRSLKTYVEWVAK